MMIGDPIFKPYRNRTFQRRFNYLMVTRTDFYQRIKIDARIGFIKTSKFGKDRIIIEKKIIMRLMIFVP